MNPSDKAPLRRGIAFVIFSVFVIWLVFLLVGWPGWRIQAEGTSAYEACRNAAMHTKGYDVWQHQETKQDGGTASVQFYDGTNYLGCSATQKGSVWVVTSAFSTLLGIPCPENHPDCARLDYYGVSP